MLPAWEQDAEGLAQTYIRGTVRAASMRVVVLGLVRNAGEAESKREREGKGGRVKTREHSLLYVPHSRRNGWDPADRVDARANVASVPRLPDYFVRE